VASIAAALLVPALMAAGPEPGVQTAHLVTCAVGRPHDDPSPAGSPGRRFLIAFLDDFKGLSGRVRLDTRSGYVTVPFDGNASYYGIEFARVITPDDIVAATFEPAPRGTVQTCTVGGVQLGPMTGHAPTFDASAFVVAPPACAVPFVDAAVVKWQQPEAPAIALPIGMWPRRVHATISLDAAGAVTDANVGIEGAFGPPTLAAIRKSTFAPAIVHCAAVASMLKFDVRFDAPTAAR
jgi:hypothetical protein